MPVFLPSRASERGNLHSTGISRFFAIPVPVPLQSRRWNASFHVGRSYSGTFTQELLCTPGLLHDRCPARCRLRPRGLARLSPLSCSCAWPARGSMRSAVSQTVPFSGLCVGFRASTLHLAERPPPRQRFRVVGSTLPGMASDMLLSITYPPSQSWLSAWSTDPTGINGRHN